MPEAGLWLNAAVSQYNSRAAAAGSAAQPLKYCLQAVESAAETIRPSEPYFQTA
ncbi:hypothetical protein [Neisseria musculi]|uniref:hypothetical protein n=1 Tax=Neisseria musculi TaxID=1815583 RepID=UPI00164BB04D|nr:hypothetical protein [Neisseria musculi]